VPLLMSAFTPKADSRPQSQNVRFGPQADSCGAAKMSLFDHFVCSREQRWRDGEAERLCGLEIEDHGVFGSRLHW
jgi:hypothetical protein